MTSNKKLTCYLFTAIVVLLTITSSKTQEIFSFQDQINTLYDQLNSNYWAKDQKFLFPIKWQHKKGIYESEVHFNYVDHRNTLAAHYIRDHQKVDDVNMFVTNFVLYGLLEAHQLGAIKIDEHRYSESLMAINGFRDKNIENGIPQYNFWNQVNINGTWVAYATNLLNAINLLPTLPDSVVNFLDNIGFAYLASAKDIGKYFVIPADNDDSSVNLALLAFLKQTKSPHYQFWNSLNTKKQQFYDRALKYAYRPFGPDMSLNKNADEIDPRTYFVLHRFLQRKKEASDNPSVILPTTWLTMKQEQIPGKVVMPFSMNNVDASVCANFIFGLSFQLIVGDVHLNKELRQMMLDTTDLLIFAVQEMLAERPTLILMYYPSKFDFYWFIGRIVHLLKRHPQAVDPLPEILNKLETLMKQTATDQIIKSAQINPKGNKFWVEFLGNYAKKTRNQDALFSTCLALNAILDTWTTRHGAQIKFDEGTPQKVIEIIKNGTSYITQKLKQKNPSQMNAFFSGSIKGILSTMPYFFPSNVNYDDKHPFIDPQTSKLDDLDFLSLVSQMKGFIQKDEYEKMLTLKWYQYSVPVKQVGLNQGFGMLFPFWSSSPITQIMGITALAKASSALNALKRLQQNVRQE